VQPNGKIVVGQTFPNADKSFQAGIARLDWDGSLDPTFTPIRTGFSEGIAASNLGLTLLPDSKILVTGPFTTVNGEPRWQMARFLGDAL
jgi:hypothetical protein